MKEVLWVIGGYLILMLAFFVIVTTYGCVAARTVPSESICPVTRISDNARCLDCHYVQHTNGQRPKWMVKPNATETLPDGFSWVDEGGRKVGRMLVEEIDSGPVERVFTLLRLHGVTKLVIELQTPGGTMFEMLRIVGLMNEFQRSEGHIVETRVNGGAASAGLIVFSAGSAGHRVMSPGSLLMWHNIRLAAPSDNPEVQRVLNKLNHNINSWLSKRCKLSLGEIEDRVKEGDWWMTDVEAVEVGIADRIE